MSAALGFGVSGPHGARWYSERKLQRLIAAAFDGGVRHFDTAPFYGEAEARLGRALSALGAGAVFISTKTGTRRSGARLTKDFSETGMRADVEQSRRTLGREALDLLYLHGPSAPQIDAAFPVLEALKAEGKIRAFGVCGEGAPLAHALDRGADAIMGAYSFLDRRHEALFRQARAAGVMTVAITPLAQGALAPPRGAPALPSDYWRLARRIVRGGTPWRRAEEARSALATASGVPAFDAALAFVMKGGLASAVITTTTQPRHLAETLNAAARPIEPARLGALLAARLDPAGTRS